MAKEYNGINAEVCCFMKTTASFSVVPTWELPDWREAAKVIDTKKSKIKLRIYDWSKGKDTDSKVFVSFNLDLKDFEMLEMMVKNPRDGYRFNQTKIFGTSKDPDGRSPSAHCQITYAAHDTNGSAMLYPWMILIQNGTAVAAPGKINGAFYEARGTFKPNLNKSGSEAKLRYSLSETDMLELVMSVRRNLQMWLAMPKTITAFTEGYRALMQAKGELENVRTSYEDDGLPKMPEEAKQTPVNQEEEVPEIKRGVPANAPEHSTVFSVQILNGLIYKESGVTANCRVYQGEKDCGEREICFDSVSDQLQNVADSSVLTKMILYPVGKSVHFFGFPLTA